MLNRNKENSHNRNQAAHKNLKQAPLKKEKSKNKIKESKLREDPSSSSISKNSIDDRKVKKNSSRPSLKKKQNEGNKNRHSGNEMSLKLNFKRNRNNVRYHSDNLVSFREYCSVEGEWIPLLSGTQRQKLINLIPPTQSSEESRSKKTVSQKQTVSEQKRLENIFKDLESNYLNKDQIFIQLSQLAKQKYSDLLTGLLKKMNKNQQNPHITPIQSPRDQNGPQPIRQIQEAQSSPIKFISQNLGEQNSVDDIHRRVENLVRMREAEQLTVSFEGRQEKVVSGFTTLFEFTEILFSKICEETMVQKVLSNLRIAEGYPKLLKLKSILNEQQSYFSSSIVPEQVYESIINENEFGACVQIFSRCIYDAFNAELIKLRPYYETNGQTFPWSFKMPAPITFYEITEDTLGIAIMESRTKIITTASQLCGILLPEDLLKEGSEEKQIVDSYKMKKQMISVKQELQSAQLSKMMDLQIQNMSTILLVSVSELIMGEICEQIGEFLSG